MDQIDKEEQDSKFIQLLKKYAELSDAMIMFKKIRVIQSQALFIKQNSLQTAIPNDNEFPQYKHLEEQDIIEYNKVGMLAENQAQIGSLKSLSQIFKQFEEQMVQQVLIKQDYFIPKLINGLPTLRQELLVIIHSLKQQLMKSLMFFHNGFNIDQFPLQSIEYDQLYKVIASIIKQNIISETKLIKISKQKNSTDIILQVLESVKIRKIIPQNLFFVIMNTFGLALQNNSLDDDFMKSLFFCNYLFDFDSRQIHINDMTVYNLITEWNYQHQQAKNQAFFNRFTQQFIQNHLNEQNLKGILDSQILPYISQNWLEIRQEIQDMIEFVEKSSRFQKGSMSFKSYYLMDQNLSVKPLSQIQINFYYIPDKQFQGCTLMNGDIIINLRMLAKKLERDHTIDIKMILKQIVLYILVHEYGHIIQRSFRQTWIFQTTQLQNKSGVESCFSKESGDVLELIIFGFKKENDNQGLIDNDKQYLKYNDKQELKIFDFQELKDKYKEELNYDKQELKDNQSESNSSGDLNQAGSINLSGQSNSKINYSQIINSTSLHSVQQIIYRGIDDVEFMKEILDYNYWNYPIRRQYPISELVIKSIQQLNEYYHIDELNFKQRFDNFSLKNTFDKIDFSGFTYFMKSFQNQYLDQDSVILNTYNYINYQEYSTITYYKLQKALELVETNIKTQEK